jgi:uncharacterized protein (DUF488 family)
MQNCAIYTVGHSSRAAAELVELLEKHAIKAVVDVRAQPHSSRYPQFSTDSLRHTLDLAGIVYHWAGRQLGGRHASRAGSRHSALEAGLRGYADYMETGSFGRAATQLVNMASRAPTAILCAERLPEHCHRRLIADYLVLKGLPVMHLIDLGETCEHVLSAEARRESAQLVYDRNATLELKL